MMKTKNVKFVSGDKELYQKFKVRHVIGHGNSFVFQVQDEDGNTQCIKEIILQDKMAQFIFRKQIQLLTKLKENPHPNIVQFKGSYTLLESKSQMKSHKKGYIQMQKGITNLKTFLAQRKTYFDQQDVISFFSSMIDAFAHLQRIQVAHRDIKPSNILVFSQDPLFFKICDVGAGTAVGECDNTKERTVIGTPYYLSPELYKAHNEKRHLTNYKAYKSDAYSLGLLLIEFCCFKKIEERLKDQPNKIQARIKEIKQRYPNIIGLGKILRKMLEFQVAQRSDFLDLKKFVVQNNLLRNKLDSSNVDPQLRQKIQSQKQISLQGLQQLQQINAIVTTKSQVKKLAIHISPNINPLKATENDMLQQLGKIRHMKLTELSITIQICGVQDKHFILISDSIQKNQGLKILNLNFWNNKISNESFIPLLKSIQNNLFELEELILKFPSNNLNINELYKGLFTFEKAKSLKSISIDLSINQIPSQNLITLFKDLSMNLPLQKLQIKLQTIKSNPVHFNRAIKTLAALAQIKDFKLNVSSNSIRDQGMFGLSDIIANFNKLQKCEIILRNAQLEDKGFTQFMKTLSKRVELKQLKLNFLSNQLTQKGIINGSTCLESLLSIQSIDINFSNNKIGDSAIKQLAKSILMIKKLKKIRLALDSTLLTEKGSLYIGRLISEQPQLQQLQLSLRHNDIKLTGVQYICAGIIKIKKIKKIKISLDGTNIGDQSANYIAMCLLKLRYLTNVDLNLDNCNLTSKTVQNIINTVKQCSKKTQEITINMRKNQQINFQLFQQIKKDLDNTRVAIRIDNPNQLNQSYSIL